MTTQMRDDTCSWLARPICGNSHAKMGSQIAAPATNKHARNVASQIQPTDRPPGPRFQNCHVAVCPTPACNRIALKQIRMLQGDEISRQIDPPDFAWSKLCSGRLVVLFPGHQPCPRGTARSASIWLFHLINRPASAQTKGPYWTQHSAVPRMDRNPNGFCLDGDAVGDATAGHARLRRRLEQRVGDDAAGGAAGLVARLHLCLRLLHRIHELAVRGQGSRVLQRRRNPTFPIRTRAPCVTGTNRIDLGLSGMQNRTFWHPCIGPDQDPGTLHH
jgi:hypothetical protein